MKNNKKQIFFAILFFFFIGCVFGYVFETGLCFIQFGQYESRKSLIYGPFNVIYGLAFVIAPFLLKKKSTIATFAYSMLYGGLFEYLCSWVQENVFGTISWDYHDHFFNFDGRTSLQMMLLWGVIGIVFMKLFYPVLIQLFKKVKPTFYFPVALLLTIVFTIDILLSSLAMIREQERLKNHEPMTFIGEWIDRMYPTEVLDEVFPHRMKPGSLEELRTNQELHQESS